MLVDMVLVVDFNMKQEDGRVPALVSRDSAPLLLGSRVVASDGEGTECWAVVDEVFAEDGYVMLAPAGGTFNRDSTFRLDDSDLFV